MPTRKPYVKYPEEYKALFLRADVEGVFSIDAGTPAAAQNLRRDLYNFRLAMWEEIPRPPTEADHHLLNLADNLVFRVRHAKVIVSRNESVYQSIVKRALEEMT
jgi:hypothetical protein